jgi:hypothetical protein
MLTVTIREAKTHGEGRAAGNPGEVRRLGSGGADPVPDVTSIKWEAPKRRHVNLWRPKNCHFGIPESNPMGGRGNGSGLEHAVAPRAIRRAAADRWVATRGIVFSADLLQEQPHSIIA